MEPKSLSALLLMLMGNHLPGLPEYSQGYWWHHVPTFDVPREKWTYEQVDDVDAACSAEFGDGRRAGCVAWYQADPMEDVGIYPRIITGKDPAPELLRHEERHAQGWLHPSMSLLRSLMGAR